MKDQNGSFTQDLPWEVENPESESTTCGGESCSDDIYDFPWEPAFTMHEISHLLDRIVMDIQHLELEVIRARYRLSFFLEPPSDKYLREEIFSGMGTRYSGNPVYDSYLFYCGLGEYDDAIDTPFHLRRKQRLSNGHDDYPDQYP